MRRPIAALLLVVAAAGQLVAQGPDGATGAISGEVRRADGSPVAGATVVLTGPPPVLRRVATTGPPGLFHFTALPDGLYSVEAAHLRTSTAVAERLRLRDGERLFVHLRVEAEAPGKLTIAAQPLLDVATPNRSRVQDNPHLLLLPGDRTHDTVLPQLATVEEDSQIAVGAGGHAPLTVQGLSAAETTLFVDGSDATSSRSGLPTQHIPLELLDTQQVFAAARSADAPPAAGATVAVVTRRPGAEWRGGATLLYTDDRLRAQPRSSPVSRTTLEAGTSELVDAGLWAGGPLAPDRAWLSLGLVPEWGESGAIDRRRRPASARLALRGASNLQLRLTASREQTQDPLQAEVSPRLLEHAPTARAEEESLVAGLFIDWIADPRLALQGAVESFDYRRQVSEVGRLLSLDEERQDRSAAGLHLDLLLRGGRLHTLSFGAQWTASRTDLDASPNLTTGTVTEQDLALHLREAVQISGRLTLDLGLRAESRRSRRLGSAQSLSFDLAQTLSPRVGLAWDVRGDGQSKVYGQLAWPTPPLLHQLHLAAFAPGRAAVLDPDLEPPRAFVTVIGIDHRLLPTVRLGAELSVHRQLEAVSLLQIAVPGSDSPTVGAAVVNPGSGLAAYPYGPSLPPHPGMERRFAALTLSAQAIFPRWSGFFSYVLSDLDGNWNGVANPDDPNAPISPHTADTCATLEGCFSAGGEVSRGPLSLDRPHQIKLSGHLRLRERLTLGGFVRLESGTPFARQVPVITGEEESEVLTRLFQPEGRGSGRRLPAVTQIDLRLQYEVPLARNGHRLVVIADLRNVFDDQGVLARWPRAYLEPIRVDRKTFFAGFDPDALAAAQGVAADPHLGDGLRFAAPRRLRLGLRWEW